ncbi:hypothetical protein D3C73_1267640 [compost metagenome]
MMSILNQKRLLTAQTNNRQRHNNPMVIMCIDRRTAFKTVRTSVNDDFTLSLFHICACLAELIQVICDPVTFFITKVLHIVES